MDYKDTLDTAVSAGRFSINRCIEFEGALDPAQSRDCAAIKSKLTAREFKAFRCGMIRNTFLMEPVNDAVTSTKVAVRWSSRLEGDVRYASYETCVAIFSKLLNRIAHLSPEDFGLLKGFFNHTVVPHEMPIDYVDRFASPIHTEENVNLFLTDEVKDCISMRRLICDAQRNPAKDVFQTILADKIKVKTYLTDRAQTGDYKTNREKRWEAHPQSVQYALRRSCMQIETKLLLQIAMFEGCDGSLVRNLQREGLLADSFAYCTCPVTGDNILYGEFAHEALHPTHGRSKFQVGHLNPLKALELNGANGHTAGNISWISENGNRIQGSLSMHEVDALLRRIYQNRPELRSEL